MEPSPANQRRGPSGSGLTFLVVDDDPGIREYVELVLRSQGHEVRLAFDGPAGLRALEREKPHFVLLDLMMPDEHGLDTLEKLRAKDPHVPVVIMTGYAAMDTAVSAMRLRADDFLAKPFRPDELLGTVHAVLERRGLALDAEDAFRRRVGERVRELRVREGFSQADLARRAAVSAVQVSSIERAHSAPSLESLRRIAHALHVTLSEFFEGL